MDHSDQIIQALNEVRDEVRALRDDQFKQHADSMRRYDDVEKSCTQAQQRAYKSASQALASYLALLTLLLATAIVVLLWDR
jgi:hypothetical protein